MKTIEEKAIEYSKEVNGEYYNEPHPNIEYTLGEISEKDYKCGYLEAQRWIPIEKSKPTDQGHYLVKCKTSYPKNCDVIVAEFYEDNKMFYSESSDSPIYDVTHWRQI